MIPFSYHFMSDPLGAGLTLWLGIIIWITYLLTMFIIVHTKKDTSLGNFTWGPSVLILTCYTFFAFGNSLARQIIVTTLIFLWCARLTFYVFLRYKKGADPRYVEWLKKWRHPIIAFLFSFAWVIFLNGGFSLIMALPSMWVNLTPEQSKINWLDIIGIILWIIGFYFETISDYQLYLFSHNAENKGKVCKNGLWKYSRHPNYFGEIMMWWAIYLISLNVPYGWLTILCPLSITTTLLFVTGIPWNEKAMEGNAEYQEYKKHTSILVPWFIKK